MEQRKKTPASLRPRLITGALLVAGLTAVLAVGGWLAVAVALLALGLALYEELNALRQGGHSPVWWPSFAGLLISAPLMMRASYLGMVPVLLCMCFCIMIAVMRRRQPDLTDILASALPLFSLVVPGICLFGIMSTQSRALQLMLLVFVFTASVGGDTCAYFVGSTLGGPKLCPHISPNKTVSGCIGGLAGSVLVTALAGLCFPTVSPPFWANLLAGLAGGIAAQLGDLFASLVKRHCNIKDFGHIFPGHGGMMDRMDSVVFTAIVMYCYQVILTGMP